MEGAGLYLHVPFCRSICPYCDFAVTRGGREARARFAEALAQELSLHRGLPPRFDTIYFGGGTPSSLPQGALAAILEAARAALDVDPEAAVFLEANPEDVDATAAAAWKALGVRFLSLGVQSLDAAELRFLGRRHGADDAARATAAAREAGIGTVSADFIFGLPGQDPAQWRRTLEGAAALGVDHVSAYQLTIHEGTHFGRRRDAGRLAEMPEEEQGRFFALTHRVLPDLGYEAYEVSNFARAPEHRSRHNRKYWRHVPYLGVGPSAHSFDGRHRAWNERDLAAWHAAVAAGRRPVAGEETLGDDALALERVMLAIRTVEGLDLAAFRARFGQDLLALNRPLIERWQDEGLVVLDADHLRPTVAGLAVADGLAARLALP